MHRILLSIPGGSRSTELQRNIPLCRIEASACISYPAPVPISRFCPLRGALRVRLAAVIKVYAGLFLPEHKWCELEIVSVKLGGGLLQWQGLILQRESIEPDTSKMIRPLCIQYPFWHPPLLG